MRTVCQVVLSGSHPPLTFHALAWLKMKQCAFSKTVHTSRNMSYITPWDDQHTSTLHPYSFLSFGTKHLRSSIRARRIPATIHNKWVPAIWLISHHLQELEFSRRRDTLTGWTKKKDCKTTFSRYLQDKSTCFDGLLVLGVAIVVERDSNLCWGRTWPDRQTSRPRAEMRMPCAFRTSKYGKNVWTGKST